MADKKYIINPLTGELLPIDDLDQVYAKLGHTHPGYAQVDLATKKLVPTATHDILAEYSTDGISWHKELQLSDRYLRLSCNGGITWGEKVSFFAVDGSAPRWSYELEPPLAVSPLAWIVDEDLKGKEN